ncbi:hypothetical protein BDFB_011691 [Asbolus verrucosus]|uniref:Uncharacterized protein n=1 Tax=Asbolus verrucosus TaxID=1661398 RepID=A0A482V157_ASBVE|nr:hypothetical protein BDFB_011691 [Asbolus verrucosus]
MMMYHLIFNHECVGF